MQHSRLSAFTLVELSIVLVILGLLVGGVLSGQSLIRAAELRSIVTERDKTVTAMNAFRDKYFALPGDMPNAYKFWSSAGVAGCTDDDTTASTGCNGDGDGKLGVLSDGEPYKAWMHLGLAGLIEGQYDGVVGGMSYTTTNIPASKFSGAYWLLHSTTFPAYIAANGTAPSDGVYLSLGNWASGVLYASDLSHQEAWNIDTKTDDGKANTGKMRGNSSGDCQDDGTDAYSIAAVGGDFKGDCSITFILRN